MPALNTTLHLVLAMAIWQVQKTAVKFGFSYLDPMIEEGIANRWLTKLWFYFVLPAGDKTWEKHAAFIVEIVYDEDGSVEQCFRWQTDDAVGDGEVSDPELCQDFDAIIDRMLELSSAAPRGHWVTAITTTGSMDAEAFSKRHGYVKSRDGTKYIDCTDAVGNAVVNTEAKNVRGHVRMSKACMDGRM
ncbi:MAG: hypothetical protein ACE37H_08000 [Phycisphaeraceae bacterium]